MLYKYFSKNISTEKLVRSSCYEPIDPRWILDFISPSNITFLIDLTRFCIQPISNFNPPNVFHKFSIIRWKIVVRCKKSTRFKPNLILTYDYRQAAFQLIGKQYTNSATTPPTSIKFGWAASSRAQTATNESKGIRLPMRSYTHNAIIVMLWMEICVCWLAEAHSPRNGPRSERKNFSWA